MASCPTLARKIRRTRCHLVPHLRRKHVMTRKVRWTLLTAFLFTIATHGLLLAQSPQATISGIVTDSTGAVIPGVQVTAINPATAQRTTAITNGQGFFVLTQLAIGDYTIEAEKAGFKKFVRQALTLSTGATVALDIQLEIGAATDTVTITGETPLLQTRT